jgi:hypothetical protein
MIAGIAVVVLGGVGVLGFTQGWVGGTQQPQKTVVADVTPTVSPTTTPTTAPTTTTTPATTTTPTTTTTPRTTATPTTTTAVATVTPTTTPVPTTTVTSTPALEILTAANVISWLDTYPFGECEYAAATQIAENSVTIEAFGTSPAPFEVLASDFEKASGFAPNVGVRLINESQCALAEFLQKVRPFSTSNGPRLALTSTVADGKQNVSATLTDVNGWTNYGFLLDHTGSVINLATRIKRSGDSDLIQLTIPLSDTTERPLALVTISSREDLAHATFTKSQASKVFFTGIWVDAQDATQPVVVNVRYFKLGQPISTPQ